MKARRVVIIVIFAGAAAAALADGLFTPIPLVPGEPRICSVVVEYNAEDPHVVSVRPSSAIKRVPRCSTDSDAIAVGSAVLHYLEERVTR